MIILTAPLSEKQIWHILFLIIVFYNIVVLTIIIFIHVGEFVQYFSSAN